MIFAAQDPAGFWIGLVGLTIIGYVMGFGHGRGWWRNGGRGPRPRPVRPRGPDPERDIDRAYQELLSRVPPVELKLAKRRVRDRRLEPVGRGGDVLNPSIPEPSRLGPLDI